MGPWIVTGLDPAALRLQSRLNGVAKQDAPIASMTFGVAETLAWISAAVTLEPGDVVSMGTPPGFSDMVDGDIVECEIDGIGVLRNPVGR
jgi:2-keto-4-pentenoate hydratase/2-oxohepta-3-ene-1,7-dioic acid hydratase in catechol pathway